MSSSMNDKKFLAKTHIRLNIELKRYRAPVHLVQPAEDHCTPFDYNETLYEFIPN